VEPFLACGVPDLITKYAVFESALLGEECGTDCGLFVGLEFVGDLCGLSWREEGISGATMTYKAENDRRFANSSFAWVIVSADVGRGREDPDGTCGWKKDLPRRTSLTWIDLSAGPDAASAIGWDCWRVGLATIKADDGKQGQESAQSVARSSVRPGLYPTSSMLFGMSHELCTKGSAFSEFIPSTLLYEFRLELSIILRPL